MISARTGGAAHIALARVFVLNQKPGRSRPRLGRVSHPADIVLGILSIWMGQMDSLRAGLAAHRFVGVTRLSPLVAVPVGAWPPLGWAIRWDG